MHTPARKAQPPTRSQLGAFRFFFLWPLAALLTAPRPAAAVVGPAPGVGVAEGEVPQGGDVLEVLGVVEPQLLRSGLFRGLGGLLADVLPAPAGGEEREEEQGGPLAGKLHRGPAQTWTGTVKGAR